MKYFTFLLLFIPSIALADVYVITTPNKEIYSISEQDDAVLPAGYTKEVIKGKDIASLALGEDKTLYTYDKKKFTLDDKKVADKNKKMQDAAIARQAKADAKVSAQAKLEALGLTKDEISAIVK